MSLKMGLIHIYTGEGKGKTTAALGLALRAVGCGCRVGIFQFFKDKKFPCGEMGSIKRLGRNIKFKRFNMPHPYFTKIDEKKLNARLKKALDEADRAIKSARFDLVVLDEIIIGAAQGFIDEKIIMEIVEQKPKTVELVLTGRGASEKLIDLADYVTYMKEIKHPFRKSICARKGIEF